MIILVRILIFIATLLLIGFELATVDRPSENYITYILCCIASFAAYLDTQVLINAINAFLLFILSIIAVVKRLENGGKK